MRTIKVGYTIGEYDKINKFLLQLLQLANDGRVKVVYRGDKIENLFQRLNIFFDPQSPDYKQVAERLFMVGEKGKYFYADGIGSLSGRGFRLDDVGRGCFAAVFDGINKVAKSRRAHHVDFFESNQAFHEYFKSKEKKDEFLDAISTLDDLNKLAIKNHYLALLHQLAAINYKSKSFHVSTTTSRSVAERFGAHSRLKPAFILHAWQPTASFLKGIFKRAGLPNYEKEPFKSQKEISFFAGILPHYIIGFELKNGAVFYNPAILGTRARVSNFLHGLDIDQSNFEEVWSRTSYMGSYYVAGRNYFEHLRRKPSL